MPASKLRELLARPGLLMAPGAHDAIGARLIEQAGFELVYMTGGGTSMAHGYPDFGLLDMGEMAANAGRMARAIGVPLIADADTGYGNELNVTRTVQEYEMRGVAALHIEDQVAPKRCGHLDGKEVIDRPSFASKIRAAVQARTRPETVIIARSDARAVNGLDDAIDRVNAALDAGADIGFVEAPRSLQEMAEIPRRVRGPCLLNIVPGGRTPMSDMRVAQEMGYKLAILPGLIILPMIEAADAVLARFKADLQVPQVATPIGDTFRRFGAAEWDALRERFGAGAVATQAAAPQDVP